MIARLSWQFMLLLLAVSMATGTSTNPRLQIQEYFANYSLITRQYVCSEAEQQCFKKNQLLHEADGECYSVGERGPCAEGKVFHANMTEASRKGGHLRGTCSTKCEDPTKSPVAATGECLTRSEVESKICREDWYLRAKIDVFGQWVCEWTQLPCTPPGVPAMGGAYYLGEYNGLCSPPDVLNSRISDDNATVPAERPADHPWLQYFTNKSYVNREYPCTDEESACLQYGRLLHSDGNCYSPGQWCDKCEPGETFHVDWDELMKEDGRLQGTCKSSCKDYRQPQIVTGECEDYGSMSKICRWEWGLQTEQNAFGQMACTCGWSPSAPPTPPPSLPPPASAAGRCRAPDFSNPVRSPMYDMTLTVGFRLPCSEEQFACFREGRVLASGACHALRTQGPCAEGEELLLDKEALAHERLATVCKARPCPEGSVRLPIDGRCLTHQEVISLLCANQQVALDEFGGWQCDYEGGSPGNLTRIVRDTDGYCELPEKYGPPSDPVAVDAYPSSSDYSTDAIPTGYDHDNKIN